MPKVDLHRHLEGSIRPKTIHELHKKFPSNKSKYNLSELKQAMHVTGKEKDLSEFLQKLGTPYMIEYTKNKDSMRRFAYEACEDAANDNITYLELRCCPSNYYKTSITAEEFIDGVYKGLKQAEKDFAITTGLIISLKREEPTNLNFKIANIIIKNFRAGKVVGVDLCGDESKYPTKQYAGLLNSFYKHQIPITIHAGESNNIQSTKSVKDAINLLYAQRIGHGTIASKSQEVMNLICKKNILVEICPTSSVHTKTIDSIQSSPVSKFINTGIKISINTDDPITSNITLSNEYIQLIKFHKFDISDLTKINQDSIQHSFLPPRKKSKLKSKYAQQFKQWMRNTLNRNDRNALSELVSGI